jgi:putative oxidoreductase
MHYLVPLGRLLFAAIFILAAPHHFTSADMGYAAAKGVPMANVLVPLSGVIALLGGLSILLGFQAKIGAWLIVLFLVPVTLMMHNFWADKDAATAMMDQIMFLKNSSMLGGAIMIAYFGSGPCSLDSWIKAHKKAEK